MRVTSELDSRSLELAYEAGSVMWSRPRTRSGPSGLTTDTVAVPIEVMGIRRENPEVAVRDAAAIQVRRGRGNAHVRIGRVAVPRRRR